MKQLILLVVFFVTQLASTFTSVCLASELPAFEHDNKSKIEQSASPVSAEIQIKMLSNTASSKDLASTNAHDCDFCFCCATVYYRAKVTDIVVFQNLSGKLLHYYKNQFYSSPYLNTIKPPPVNV